MKTTIVICLILWRLSSFTCIFGANVGHDRDCEAITWIKVIGVLGSWRTIPMARDSMRGFCELGTLMSCPSPLGMVKEVHTFLVELVRSVTIVPSADRWNWNLESTGIFSVASARRRIDEICLPNIGEETNGDMSCPICDNAIESTDHLFFRCGLVRDIANKVLSWYDFGSSKLENMQNGSLGLFQFVWIPKLKKMFEGGFGIHLVVCLDLSKQALIDLRGKPSKSICFLIRSL
ncbi:hypothetical protein Tco_1188516 [Tanacetum coccineum]